MDTRKPYPVNNYEPYRPSGHSYARRFDELPVHAPTGFTCAQTEKYRGQWRDFFGARGDAKLHLEIGCYHGESLLEMARQNSNEFFIGVEWKFKEAYKASEKAVRSKMRNLVFLRANIARLPWMFAPGELDRVWILFPDPWPKFTHHKWRVLHADFFRSVGLSLNEGKEVMIKTDHCDYAAFIADELKEADCFESFPETDADQIWSTFPATPFEKMFFKKSESSFVFSLRRNANRISPPAPLKGIFATAVHTVVD